jgi:hypothetical protein
VKQVSNDEFDADRAIKILNHPVRIKIIELLATKGAMSWKELSKEVGTSTGALYHHIDMLERIVDRDSSKRYVLTSFGLKVYDYMRAHTSTRDTAALGKLVRQRSTVSGLSGFFVPRSLISKLTQSRSAAVASTVGFSSLVLASMIFSRSRIFLLAFLPSQDLLQSGAFLWGSLVAMVGIAYLGARLAGSKADPLVLLSSAALSLLPLAGFSLLLRGLATSGSLGVLSDRNVLTLVFAIFQGWSASIVGAGLSVASGIRVEKALLVSLTLVYITILIVFAQGLSFI